MASCTVTLTAEMDLVHDALSDIELIFRTLAKCHGQQYRTLERRIERLFDAADDLGEPRTHWIGGGRFIIEPFPEMKAIIRDARALEVI